MPWQSATSSRIWTDEWWGWISKVSEIVTEWGNWAIATSVDSWIYAVVQFILSSIHTASIRNLGSINWSFKRRFLKYIDSILLTDDSITVVVTDSIGFLDLNLSVKSTYHGL